MADRYPCTECRKDVAKTKNDRYRSHSDGDGEPCEMSSEEIPQHVLDNGPVDGTAPADVPVEGVDYAMCPQCTRKVELTRLGYFKEHDQTLRGGDRCPVSGVRHKHARRTEDKLLPGDEPATAVPKVKDSATPAKNRGLAITSSAPTSTNADAGDTRTEPLPSDGEINWSDVPDLTHPGVPAPDAGSSVSTEMSSLESPTTSTLSPTPEDEPSETVVFSLGTSFSPTILQPFSPFLQPEAWAEPKPEFLQPPEYETAKAEPMGELAKELATKIKETFYAYSNRKTTDNRSAQVTLGPSEIGTPCDRRLAMALMGIPAVNPGGDGWAAFVGTCTHEGMAKIYEFADAGTGRYAVELPVFTGVSSVPRGTTDLLDRRDGTVVDWKVMGKYSLDKFKKQGPSETYRTQAHTYGLGAERAGEKVKNVAVVGLPRAGRSLDEMHIWTEKYDRKLAQAALDRVERIANELTQWAGLDVPAGNMRKAQSFETGDDCQYCPFYLKGDKEMERGCPGK